MLDVYFFGSFLEGTLIRIQKNQCFLVLFFVHVRIFGSLMIKRAEIFYLLTMISTIGNIRACFNTHHTNLKSKQHGDAFHKSAEYFKI